MFPKWAGEEGVGRTLSVKGAESGGEEGGLVSVKGADGGWGGRGGVLQWVSKGSQMAPQRSVVL